MTRLLTSPVRSLRCCWNTIGPKPTHKGPEEVFTLLGIKLTMLMNNQPEDPEEGEAAEADEVEAEAEDEVIVPTSTI